MCHACFPDYITSDLRERGRAAGREMDFDCPFPVGSISRQYWEEGVEIGIGEIPPVEDRSLAAKGSKDTPTVKQGARQLRRKRPGG